jgi:hypothetical protein
MLNRQIAQLEVRGRACPPGCALVQLTSAALPALARGAGRCRAPQLPAAHVARTHAPTRPALTHLPAAAAAAAQQEAKHALDAQIQGVTDSLKAMAEDPMNKSLLFVTDDDITGLPCFDKDTLFAVKAPQVGGGGGGGGGGQHTAGVQPAAAAWCPPAPSAPAVARHCRGHSPASCVHSEPAAAVDWHRSTAAVAECARLAGLSACGCALPAPPAATPAWLCAPWRLGAAGIIDGSECWVQGTTLEVPDPVDATVAGSTGPARRYR